MTRLNEKRDTKKRMIETAITLFREKGVSAVSAADICRESKVTRNAFYYHFDSKELLFDAIGDYLTEHAKQQIPPFDETKPAYPQIWEVYRPFYEYQLYLGADIMTHCNYSRESKGKADTYMYIDTETAAHLAHIIDVAKANKEIRTVADSFELVDASYAILRGVNIKWCFRWGESDLLGDCRKMLNTLFLPKNKYALK